MIVELMNIITALALPLNFGCHLTIFLGGYYVALHCRALPNWVATSLWYIGLASLLTAITIVLEWVYGPTFELSYSNVGLVGETLLNITLASTVALLFCNTIIKDVRNSRKRVTKDTL